MIIDDGNNDGNNESLYLILNTLLIDDIIDVVL